ncbi:MAG: hypothetical protein K2G35_07245 [Duncaniella sp.]|nr:hypothetical protein [Duncaniella sp.]
MISLGPRELAAASIGRRSLVAIALGAKRLWEAVSNCIAGGWWQRGHGWQHGIGWGANRRR